ncbi:MAG TPA: ABC transporter ATP-binding protein [Chloroflexota bacterium]|nr:ABC transporter ATP-binding protein [Chloroflexota bacterium]
MVAIPTSLRNEAPVILEAEHVSRHFSAGGSFLPWTHRGVVHAVDDVTLQLRPGRITALVGESGSGKSTVARVLARLYPPTTGRILFQGENVLTWRGRRARAYRRQVQMIFQDPFSSLNPVKRVEYVLSRPLLVHHIVPAHRVRERVHELLTTVGLVPAAEFAAKYPHQLSGGQRQRVAIARALAVEPAVLLADEPISMLDVSIRMGILNLMLDLKQRMNLAFLYITHDVASARYVADEIIVMYAGHVVERGETLTVLRAPQHPYTRLLLSAVPNPAAGLTRQRLEGRGEVRTIVDPPPGCRFVSRCPLAEDVCARTTPELVESGPDRWVRCHLYPRSTGPQGRVSHD